MKNILAESERKISKIFILLILFIGVVSIFSYVNAANEKINLTIGETKVIPVDQMTDWGGIEDIVVKIKENGSKTTGLEVKKVGKETMFYGGKDISVTAKKAGTYIMEVAYFKSMWADKSIKTYEITVSAKLESIKFLNTTLVKTSYKVGEKVNLNGLPLQAVYNDNTQKKIELSEVTYTPQTVSKNDKKITITYQGKTCELPITVTEPQNSNNGGSGNNSSNIGGGNNANQGNQEEVYTSNLKKGDTLKLKDGSGWKKYKSKSMNSGYQTLTGGKTICIQEIDGNWLTIKGETTFKYLYYGSTASGYFSKVTETNTTPNEKPNETPNTTNTSAPQYIDGTEVKKGDSIKMSKGNSWKVYTNNSCTTVKSYIKVNENVTYKVEDINGNIVKLSKNSNEVGYIKWYNSSTGAKNYFSKVEIKNDTQGNVETNKDTYLKPEISTELVTETLDVIVDLISDIIITILESIAAVCK